MLRRTSDRAPRRGRSASGLLDREALVHQLVELPLDRLPIAVCCSANHGPSCVFCGDPHRPSRDQEVQQIGTLVEQDGESRGVIMPERQRANRLCWLLEVPQLDGQVAGLALQNDHQR
jgi:hypothetical protein